MKYKNQVKKRPDGRYPRRISITNEITNEVIIKFIYGYSNLELDRKEDAMRAKYGAVINSDFTLYTYLTNYIAQRRAELDGLDGQTTLDNYEGHINNYIKDTVLGNTPLNNVSVFMFRSFFTNFVPKKKGVTGKRVKQLVYTILKKALTQAVYDGYITANPLDRIERPQYKSKVKGILTNDQVTNILRMVRDKNPQLANMFNLDVILGLRRTEIIALKFTDIDFKAKTLNINKGIKRINKKWTGKSTYLGSTKTPETVRVLPLDKFSINTLRQQLKLAKNDYRKNGRVFKMDGFVFTDEYGEPFKPDYATKTFQQYRDELKLPKSITLHSLRHTAATRIAENGIGTRMMQDWFGWATGAMADRYTHGTDLMKQKIVNIINSQEKDFVKHFVKIKNG